MPALGNRGAIGGVAVGRPSPFKGVPLDGHPALASPAPPPERAAIPRNVPLQRPQPIPRAHVAPPSPVAGLKGSVGPSALAGVKGSEGPKPSSGGGLFSKIVGGVEHGAGDIANFLNTKVSSLEKSAGKTLPHLGVVKGGISPAVAAANPNVRSGLEHTSKEAVEIPVQVGASTIDLAKFGLNGVLPKLLRSDTSAEQSAEGKALISGLRHSELGDIATLHFKEALKQFSEHPDMSTFELAGAASAADSFLGRAGEAIKPGTAPIADRPSGPEIVARKPQDVSTGSTVPTRAYSRGLVQNKLQRAGTGIKLSEKAGELRNALLNKYHNTQGVLVDANREIRDRIQKAHGQAAKDMRLDPNTGNIAAQLWAQGVLPHPDTLSDYGYQSGHAPNDMPLNDVSAHPSAPYVRPKALSSQDRQGIQQIDKARGNPDAPVTIHRSMPARSNTINPGDWVTTSKEYADLHASQRPGYHVVTKDVPAGDVRLGAKTGLSEARYQPRDAASHYAWRDKLSELANRWDKPVEGETPAQRMQRETNAHEARVTLQDADMQKDNGAAVYKYVENLAKEKNQLEPGLAAHTELSLEQMQKAKLVTSMREYYPDVHVRDGEFMRAGKTLSTPEVEDLLRVKGVNPDHLSYISHDPARGYNTGMSSSPATTDSGRPTTSSTKQLTGVALQRGHADLSFARIPQQVIEDNLKPAVAQQHAFIDNEFTHNKGDTAGLITDERLAEAHPEDQKYFQKLKTDLENAKHLYWERDGNKTPWEQASSVAKQLETLDPKIQLEPTGIVHPFARSAYRDPLLRNIQNGLEVSHEDNPSRFPNNSEDQAKLGRVGLVDKNIAKAMRDYEKYKASQPGLPQTLGEWWRTNAIATAVKHFPGIQLEYLQRVLAAGTHSVDYLRGRLYAKVIANNRDINPVVAQQYDGLLGGTLQNWATQLNRADPKLVGKYVAKTGAEPRLTLPQKLSSPLRTWVKGLSTIQHWYSHYFERPYQTANLGQTITDELKKLNRPTPGLFRMAESMEKDLAQGLLHQKTLDNVLREAQTRYGNWQSASPTAKTITTFMPFYRWFSNALRFIYITMPRDHPMKTAFGVLAYNMSHNQLMAEGQGYSNLGRALIGAPTKQEAASWQQGSVPIGGGQRWDDQYYSAQGAVSEGLTGELGDITPMFKIVTTAIEKLKKEQKSGVASEIAESLFPPARYGTELLEGKPPSQVFNPLRIEEGKKANEHKAKSGKLGALKSLPALAPLPKL